MSICTKETKSSFTNSARMHNLLIFARQWSTAVAVLCLSALWSAAQQGPDSTEPIYYEHTQDGRSRFYYDERYFLVDRNCTYKAIERDGAYDFTNQTFVGIVRDYDLEGRLVLEGHYRDGHRDGLFRAYHPSGFLKWEIRYQADIPTDTLRFYYPDGLPYLEYRVTNDELIIESYWDLKGRQRVKKGRGSFEMVSELDAQYHPSGHRWIRRSGRVREGKPDFIIHHAYIYESGEEIAAGSEEFRNGEFVRGDDFMADENYYSPRMPTIPRVWHHRAEQMISKRCNIDDHLGFSQYLADQWQAQFAQHIRVAESEQGSIQLYRHNSKHEWELLDGFQNSDLKPQMLSFSIEIDKEGLVKTVSPEQSFDTEILADVLLHVVNQTAYWIPSWNGDFIDDELTVSLRVLADSENGHFVLHDLHVVRSKGM